MDKSPDSEDSVVTDWHWNMVKAERGTRQRYSSVSSKVSPYSNGCICPLANQQTS
ncbi:hypothetical protein DPMN_169784 [Dreissena polymorpha]|uniref:Uncharacterized protein n=1 Tax=Dreissena polymorpha TaxID=45954 RepID=A0A9D4DYC4_DREPO|nr:hypothetical protein DPMN_169784 [Dreissena polymorpha]